MSNISGVEIDSDEYLRSLSREILDTLKSIAGAAQKELSKPALRENPLANPQNFTNASAQSSLDKISGSLRESYQYLQREPAIARIIYEDETGEKDTLYISRTTPVTGSGVQLASQRAPLGRLASLDVGDSTVIEFSAKSKECTLIEVSLLKPTRDEKGWDATDTVYKHETGVKTIRSLRQLLAIVSAEGDFEAFLDADEPDSTVTQGIAHQIRTAIGLRDQPILDKIQDKIYRLPLNSQLFIAGPPGTGKTTTLIKRLGQKLDYEYLSPLEKRLVEKAEANTNIPYEQNWLMFTPTDLLKHYLKEAFSREQVPASDDHIRTWEKTRRYLARNVFGLLQSGNLKGKFIFKNDTKHLKPEVSDQLYAWFEGFEGYYNEQFFKGLETAFQQFDLALVAIDEAPLEHLTSLREVLAKPGNTLQSVLNAIEQASGDIHPLIDKYNSLADKNAKSAVRALYKLDSSIFARLAELLNKIALEKNDGDEEADDDLDDEGEESIQAQQFTPQSAAKRLIWVFKSIGRTRYLGRSVSKKSTNGRVLDFLDDKTPHGDEFKTIGKYSAIVSNLRLLTRGHRNYIKNVASLYKRYRREHPDYYQDKTNNQFITATELDAVVLLTLKSAHNLLDISFISRNINEPRFSFLSNIVSQFRLQVFVDEATDFSALQLAIMQLLVNPATKSFFACGDFNQRLTQEGIKKQADLDALPMRLDSKRITRVYRQSKILNTLSHDLLSLMGGDVTSAGELPKDYNHPAVSPTLVEGLNQIEEIARWLAQRIEEIEKLVNALPTIGVLVNNESIVEPLAAGLNKALAPLNIEAEACLGGKSLGEKADVRVFSTEYIKGLEFEAVFFIGVDKLAEINPDLFDKYLYVGVTRAATYLGLTCEDQLPCKLKSLRSVFIEDWSS